MLDAEDLWVSRNITLKLSVGTIRMLDELAAYLGTERSNVIRLMMLFALENFYAWLAWSRKNLVHPHDLNIRIYDELSKYRHVYI